MTRNESKAAKQEIVSSKSLRELSINETLTKYSMVSFWNEHFSEIKCLKRLWRFENFHIDLKRKNTICVFNPKIYNMWKTFAKILTGYSFGVNLSYFALILIIQLKFCFLIQYESSLIFIKKNFGKKTCAWYFNKYFALYLKVILYNWCICRNAAPEVHTPAVVWIFGSWDIFGILLELM